MASKGLRRIRLLVPIGTCVATLMTLLICILLVRTERTYIGGLIWPFFSMMGREGPGYYVFCIGLSIASIFACISFFLNYQYHKGVIPTSRYQLLTLAKCTLVLACISLPGLSLLAYCNELNYPNVHSFAARWFLATQVFAITLNTTLSNLLYKIAEDMDQKQRRRQTLRLQLWFALSFIAGVTIFYFPVDDILSTSGTNTRLSIADCINVEKLDQEYCSETVRYNDIDTKLPNYSDNFTAVQIQALGEIVSILSLLGYSISFLSLDYYEDEELHGKSSTYGSGFATP